MVEPEGTPTETQDPPVEGTPPAEPTPPQVLDMEGLPDEMKGKTPEQIAEVWDLMRQSISAINIARETPPATPPPPVVEPEPAMTKESFREMFDEDPQAALDEYTRRTLAPMIEPVAENALEGAFSAIRQEIDDFGDYEKDTREVIKTLGVPAYQLRPDQVRLAYLIARGRASEKTAARPPQPPNAPTDPPTPKLPDEPTVVTLDPVQEEIAAKMGMSKDDYKDWLSGKKDHKPYKQMDVPTEAKYERG